MGWVNADTGAPVGLLDMNKLLKGEEQTYRPIQRRTDIIAVELSADDFRLCRDVARQRDQDAKRAGADEGKYGSKGLGYDLHFEGCLGECACARGLGREWTGARLRWHNDQDVGEIEVRCTKHQHGRLLLRKESKKDMAAIQNPWVLVLRADPYFTLAGWRWGYEIKHPDNWGKLDPMRPPCWSVPQSILYPMNELPWSG